jgi:hypothetical protein
MTKDIKIMNIFRVIVIMWAFVLPSVSYASESVETVAIVLEHVNALNDAERAKQQELLAAVTSETKIIVAKATTIMDRARAMLFADTTTKKEVTKIVKTIIKQNSIAAQAQQKLKRLHKRLTQENTADDVQVGYVSQCIVGAQDFGKNLLAPFSYTKNEKNIAQQIVDGLLQQRAKIMQDYDALPLYTSRNKIQLKKYECAIMQLDTEIYHQKCITGEKMSFKKQAALLAGAAAVTIAGVVLTHKFLLPEMCAVKPEDTTVLDSQDEPTNVDQEVDIISSELTIVEPEQLQEQASFSVEVAEEKQENRDSNLEQHNTVEQAVEELDTLEVPLQEQESILSNPSAEKGYLDAIKDYLGLSDSQEKVEVVTVPAESTIVVEHIVTEEPVIVKGLEVVVMPEEVQAEQIIIEDEPIVESTVLVIEEKVEVVTVSVESTIVEEPVTVEELEAKVSEVIIEIPVVVEVLEDIEPSAEVKEEAKEIIEVVTVPVESIIVEELELKELEVIEVAVEENTIFDSAIDLDGNPVMVIPSITKEKEYVAHDEAPCKVMSTQEELAVELAELDVLKTNNEGYGILSYFGYLSEDSAIEEKVKKIAELENVLKIEQDIRQKAYQVKLDKLEADERAIERAYNGLVKQGAGKELKNLLEHTKKIIRLHKQDKP